MRIDERVPAPTDPIRDRRSAQMAKEVDGPCAIPRALSFEDFKRALVAAFILNVALIVGAAVAAGFT